MRTVTVIRVACPFIKDIAVYGWSLTVGNTDAYFLFFPTVTESGHGHGIYL